MRPRAAADRHPPPGRSGGHAHHGGAWKVAYADFVTAMMAFFLLLWLISSASEQKPRAWPSSSAPPRQYRAARRRRRRAGRHDGAAERGAAAADGSPFDRPAAAERPRTAGRPRRSASPATPRPRLPSRPPKRPSGRQRDRASSTAAKAADPGRRCRPRPSCAASRTACSSSRRPRACASSSWTVTAAADVPGRQRRHVPAHPPAADGGGRRRWPSCRTGSRSAATPMRRPIRPGPATTIGACPPIAPTRRGLVLVGAGLDPLRVAEIVGKGAAEPLLPDRPMIRATGACRSCCCMWEQPAAPPPTARRNRKGRRRCRAWAIDGPGRSA